ncbi:MAG: hypothetical protein GY696_32045 [Gammaproteobacteria bacterium]|nr:hypothetical protein [Gammaproteobacteria bacterium]
MSPETNSRNRHSQKPVRRTGEKRRFRPEINGQAEVANEGGQEQSMVVDEEAFSSEYLLEIEATKQKIKTADVTGMNRQQNIS